MNSILRLFLALYITVAMSFGAIATDLVPYNDEFDGKAVELLVSYKIIIDNHIATKERYRVSPVLNPQAHKGYKVAKECVINAGDYRIMDDMPYFIAGILKAQKEQVLECLYNNEVFVIESTKGRHNAINSRTSLEISPTRIKARLVEQNIILQILSPLQVSSE